MRTADASALPLSDDLPAAAASIPNIPAYINRITETIRPAIPIEALYALKIFVNSFCLSPIVFYYALLQSCCIAALSRQKDEF